LGKTGVTRERGRRVYVASRRSWRCCAPFDRISRALIYLFAYMSYTAGAQGAAAIE
jgi:hypothetical protein